MVATKSIILAALAGAMLGSAVRVSVPKVNEFTAGDDPTVVVYRGNSLPKDGLPLPLAEPTVEFIINHETGGRTYFTRLYQRPQDPKFASGVTIGFGYDLKFHTPAQIRRDWAGVATPAEIAAMVSVSGMDGSVYRRIRHKVHITWEEARIVFYRVTLPRWCTRTKNAFNLEKTTLHPYGNGALVSLCFNRGTSMRGSSRKEMRLLRDGIASRAFHQLRGYLYSMQRLWPHKRLRERRRGEGDFIQKGLDLDKRYGYQRS